MDKPETLARLEETALSTLMRESRIAFFSSLTLHSLAMAFVVGINFAVALRLIGFAPRLKIAALSRFYVVHWFAAALIFISGAALLLAYPAKALTNPVFYVKLCAVFIGLLMSKRIQSTFSNKPEVSIDSAHQTRLPLYCAMGCYVDRWAISRLHPQHSSCLAVLLSGHD